jgi:Domain of unknown function (DUF4395)
MELTAGERGLAMQGFAVATDPAIRRVAPWLRVTPSVSAVWLATGTALGSPPLLFGFAAVSAFGASRHRHPFDHLYAIAHRRERLPDNPPPRRFAMGLAAAWAAAAAALLASGHRRAGRVAGGLLVGAAATVATTNFCLGSWIYRQLIAPTWRRRSRSA